MPISFSDFNNNQFEYISPEQYEVTQFEVTERHPKIEIVLENELTIFQPIIYEKVQELKDNIDYSNANLKIHDISENVKIGKKHANIKYITI